MYNKYIQEEFQVTGQQTFLCSELFKEKAVQICGVESETETFLGLACNIVPVTLRGLGNSARFKWHPVSSDAKLPGEPHVLHAAAVSGADRADPQSVPHVYLHLITACVSDGAHESTVRRTKRHVEHRPTPTSYYILSLSNLYETISSSGNKNGIHTATAVSRLMSNKLICPVCVSAPFPGIDRPLNKRTNRKTSGTASYCLGFGKVCHFIQYSGDTDWLSLQLGVTRFQDIWFYLDSMYIFVSFIAVL